MDEPGASLGAHEWQLLAMIEGGKSAAEAGDELGLSIGEVAERLAVIRRRLDVSSTAEAVAVVFGRQRPGTGPG